MEDWSPQVFNGPGPNGNKSTIHTAVTAGNGIGGSYTFPAGQQASTAFHAYGVIWSANMMQFYVDNATKPFLIETGSNLSSGDMWPFNAQTFVLMNVAGRRYIGRLDHQPCQPAATDGGLYPSVFAFCCTQPNPRNPPSITVKAGATTSNSSMRVYPLHLHLRSLG